MRLRAVATSEASNVAVVEVIQMVAYGEAVGVTDARLTALNNGPLPTALGCWAASKHGVRTSKFSTGRTTSTCLRY
eukprot:SAG31_NODE_200_length_20519_cov_57.688833_3_plen_76_part_00